MQDSSIEKNNYLSWFMWKLLGAAVRVAMYKQVFSVFWLVVSVSGGFYFDSLWISIELIWISRSRWSFISWPYGTKKIIPSGEQSGIISTFLACDVLMADFKSLATPWSLKFGKTFATWAMPRSYNKMDDTDPLAANESLVFTIRCFICKLCSLNSSLISSHSRCRFRAFAFEFYRE